MHNADEDDDGDSGIEFVGSSRFTVGYETLVRISPLSARIRF